MRMLGPRPVTHPAELAAIVAECLSHLEAGLRLLDVAAVDARGRLALILRDIEAGPEAVLRALESGAWWRAHTARAARVFAGTVVDPHAAPRTLLVATRVTDRARRLLRALGPLAPAAVECRVFDDADHGAAVSLDRVDARERDVARAGTGSSARDDTRSEPAPARATSTARAPGDVHAQRAAVLIERLERLRFSEGFR